MVAKSVSARLGFTEGPQYPQAMIEHWQSLQQPSAAGAYTGEFPLPDLSTGLDKHFEAMAQDLAGPALALLDDFARFELPPLDSLPDNIIWQEGWTCYPWDGPPRGAAPDEDVLVFDVETWVAQGEWPILAAAIGKHGVYVWLHPAIVSGKWEQKLIPIGTGRVVIGHNAGYDRIRVQDEYQFGRPNLWVDTLSMHSTLYGIASGQRWWHVKQRVHGETPYTPPWADAGAPNSLIDAYNYAVYRTESLLNPDVPYMTVEDKAIRGLFVNAKEVEEFMVCRHDLVKYAMRDVWFTTKLFQHLWFRFCAAFSSRVPVVGMMLLGTNFLPIKPDWQQWVEHVERVYAEYNDRAKQLLLQLAERRAAEGSTGDAWDSQLDWTPIPRGKLKGKPEWYKGVAKLSVKSRLAHILLKLEWEGQPIVYCHERGWCYQNAVGQLIKVPHKDGIEFNVGQLLTADFANYMEAGVLTSRQPEAKQILEIAVAVSYWTSVRSRVKQQLAIYVNDWQMIIPCLIPRGTISGRTVENLWNTVCSPKPNKIGSELKARIQAPPGWRFVHADFTGQEITIASIYADAFSNAPVGATPLSMMVLTGNKSAGTDPHSMLAKQVGISRSDAKTAAFSILYGGGVKRVASVLRNNPLLSEEQAISLAKELLRVKKGVKGPDGLWRDGTDSDAFNFMTQIANSECPTLPLFGTKISTALRPDACYDDFITARMNWTIQASGAEILAGFYVAVEWLFKRYGVRGRFIWSLYDEMLSMVHADDAHLAAWCYQVAHLWVWALLRQRLGQHEMPASTAYFPDITIGSVYRKEANQSTVTPSNPDGDPTNDISLTPAECITQQVWDLLWTTH